MGIVSSSPLTDLSKMASKPFGKDGLRYEELCEKDVLALTGIEFDTWDRERSPPSLDFHFREGNGWTFGGFRNKSLLFPETDFR